MTITRTALGTATDKTSALTLTISNVTVDPGASLLVGIGYDVGDGEPIITWGQQTLDIVRTVSGNGIVARVASYYRRAADPRTNDLIATWTTTAPTAKAMIAVEVLDVAAQDVVNSQAEAATTDPDSGTATATSFADEFLFGICVSEGPSSDAIGTVQNSFTSGQRAGTVGAPPVSNITIHEIYKITTATESAQAAKTGATSRNWATILATFRAPRDFRMGITPSDLHEMRRIFDTQIPPLARRNHAFHWNNRLDRWELYEADIDGATLVASISPDDQAEWQEI